MMAKREKDRLYYEITREKPYGDFQTLMVGGSAGSVVGFLIASLVGACAGMEMDAVVLTFLVSSFLGFFFGAVLTWLAVRYFSKWVSDASLTGVKEAPAPAEEVPPVDSEIEAEAVVEESAVVEDDETKGKTVDWISPEFSTDKQ
jgi:hypothetical protein